MPLELVGEIGGVVEAAQQRQFLQGTGTQNVIYQEAPEYLYTNPLAMMRFHFHCLAVRFGVTLLVAALATGLVWAYRLLSKRKVWKTTLQVAFWCAMSLAFLYLAMVCVWEWGLAWLALFLCIRFLPTCSLKGVFATIALVAAVVILGFQRMELQSVSRRYDAFWDLAEKCATMESFEKSFGEPAIICRHIPEEEKEWFDSLAHFDASLWHPGKTLAGFISPQMPGILMLPWFDDEGRRIALAWCDLTPECRELLAKRAILYQQ